MLTSDNAGKYLSQKWHDDRVSALTDSSLFDADELTWLEVTAETNADQNHEHFTIDTQPVDSRTEPRIDAIDIRKFPKNGGA